MNADRHQIAQIMAGDERAFSQLVEGHKRLVSHVVFRLIPGESDREDLCQDVFLKIYQNLSRFEYKSKLSTWIARIAYNTCLNFLEKKKLPLYEDLAPDGTTVDDCLSDSESPVQWAQSRQVATRLCNEIDRLPVHYGLILSLYHLQEMSYAEIGRILSMPDGTVKSYLFRARQMLKEKMLAEYAQEELCA